MLPTFALYWASDKIYRKPHRRSLVKGFVKMTKNNYVIKEDPSKHDTLNQCWPMLGQRRRRWANSSPALVQCIVFAGQRCFKRSLKGPQQRRDIDHVLVQCCPIVSDAGPTLKQLKGNVTCLLRGAHGANRSVTIQLDEGWQTSLCVYTYAEPSPSANNVL